MRTSDRLTYVYRHAKVLEFDDQSKFIFFSDIHRGDDSISDEFTRNQSVLLHALNYYYKKGYTYIEVGDGDELWEYKNFDVIRLAHTDIFTAIKKFYDAGRFIMIYGNHNNLLRYPWYVKRNYYQYYDEYNQKKVDLFPGLKPQEAVILKHKKTKQRIFVLHGHQGDIMNDQLWFVSMCLLRYLWRYFHIVGFGNPTSPARNLFKRHKIEKVYDKWIQKHKIMLICGHTHRQKFPKKGELPYFNTGCCIRTRGICGIEILNGTIQMVDWRVSAKLDGDMHVLRTIVRGPEPLEHFDDTKPRSRK